MPAVSRVMLASVVRASAAGPASWPPDAAEVKVTASASAANHGNSLFVCFMFEQVTKRDHATKERSGIARPRLAQWERRWERRWQRSYVYLWPAGRIPGCPEFCRETLRFCARSPRDLAPTRACHHRGAP